MRLKQSVRTVSENALPHAALLLLLAACSQTTNQHQTPTPAQQILAHVTSVKAIHDATGVLGLVPYPRTVIRSPGALLLDSGFTISTSSPGETRVEAQALSSFKELGASPTIVASPSEDATLQIAMTDNDRELGPEGYRLDVSARGIRISANKDAGLFYGLMTLQQLASVNGTTLRPIPFVHIVDWPEYRWRGLHLDVSRHFFSVKTVETYIDTMSRFKLNTFHWHLTDDQGWRLEVPAYPALTRIAACRKASQTGGYGSRTNDGIESCGFYTLAEVRQVVAYAKARHVRIVPEIEGPGHSVEVLAALPDLACTSGPYETLVYWGSTKYSLCPTRATFEFYDTVFKELASVFPDPMIHIGGDEVPYYSWRGDSRVSELMREQGLSDYGDVQGYFTRRIEQIAHNHGRRIVGWDEIDKAGTSRDAVIMAWTGSIAGTVASSHGNDVVMTPHEPLYFDAYQGPPENEPPAIGGLTTLRAVYDYNPVASINDASQRDHIIGAQANVWTEYISTQAHLWYMTYPRALALAEICWTPRSDANWKRFRAQSALALARLEPLGITFRVPEVAFRVNSIDLENASDVLDRYRVDYSKDFIVELRSSVSNATLHYTLDGTEPNEESSIYHRPLHLTRSEANITVTAIAIVSGYRVSAPSVLTLANGSNS